MIIQSYLQGIIINLSPDIKLFKFILKRNNKIILKDFFLVHVDLLFLSFDHGNILAKDLLLFLITNLKEIKENLGFKRKKRKIKMYHQFIQDECIFDHGE